MQVSYEQKIRKMAENHDILKKSFLWEEDMILHLVALTYAIKNKTVNIEQIEEVRNYIKSKTGMFSHFRGRMCMTISGLLCASYENPVKRFDDMLALEPMMKKAGMKQGTYIPTALYTLINVSEVEVAKEHMEKAGSIYKEMKQNHPFLTGGDDYVLAIMLVSSKHNPQILENYYTELNKNGFSKSNGLQMLSHILALSPNELQFSVERCVSLLNILKDNKFRVYPMSYPAVGLMSILDLNQTEVAEAFMEVAGYLKKEKGFKWLGRDMILLMASGIIVSDYILKQYDQQLLETTLNLSVQAVIAAQQAAMIAAITASNAAASSAAT